MIYYARQDTIRQAIYRTEKRAEGAISPVELRMVSSATREGRERCMEREARILDVLRGVYREVLSERA